MKRTLLVSSLLFILFVFSPKLASAITPMPTPPPGAGYSLVCMKETNKFTPNCSTTDPTCLPKPASFTYDSHNVRIAGSGFPQGTKVYIVGCVQTNNNFMCTTGNDGTDQQVRSLGFQIQKAPGHEFFVYGGNPVTTSGNSLTANLHSQTPESTAHSFYGVYVAAGGVASGAASSLQYGTFDFNQDASKCTSIRWDPDGRVFDSKTLEPLPGATVQFLDSRQVLVNLPGIDATKFTEADGKFSFFAGPGTYFLNVFKSGYQFPVNISDVSPYYGRAYSCDVINPTRPSLYTQGAASTGLKPLQPIIETNRPLHCDIPMTPVSGLGYRSQPVGTVVGQVAIPRSTVTKYSGYVSHPLAKVVLAGNTTGTIIKTITAEKDGSWEYLLDNRKVPEIAPGVPDAIVVRFVSNDLTSNVLTRFFNSIMRTLLSYIHLDAYAQITTTQSIVFDPILRYVEGYAYDRAGNVLPNATVTIKLKMSGGTEYKTQADEKGYFVILPEHLPIFAYTIVVTPPGGGPISYTTSDFVKANKDYLTSQKINLMTATKNNQTIGITPGVKNQNTFIGQQLGNKGSASQNPSSPTTNAAETDQANLILTVIIFVILIGAVVGGIYLYIQKKKHMTQEPFV